MHSARRKPKVAIVGGGPAGLMAAFVLGNAGVEVDLYEAMPSLGRKLLVAGVGGLNLTHSESLLQFVSRFGESRSAMRPILERFTPTDLRDFARELGIETTIGSSGRVFPSDFKAAPLLRAWVRRLKSFGVRVHPRHRLADLGPGPILTFETTDGRRIDESPDAAILALGGASWRRLGSDGFWTPLLSQLGVDIRPFQPSNCGFEVSWSPHFRDRFEGTPLKNIALRTLDRRQDGEIVITKYGVEGGAVYALSAALRDQLSRHGTATLELDLKPSWSVVQIAERLIASNTARSTSERLRRALRLPPIAFPLLREVATSDELTDPARCAKLLKALPLEVRGVRPLDEAISSAGGIRFDAVTDALELRALPRVFVAGEMLDYDPPTGGYLLQAAFATGFVAAEGVLSALQPELEGEAQIPTAET